MQRRNKIFLVLFLLIVVTLILIVVLNLEYFNYLIQSNIKTYGYPAVFSFSFLSDVIDQPIGPEIVASFGAIFGLNILYVFLLASFGSLCISLINFYGSRTFLSNRVKNSFTSQQHGKHLELFKKYGKFSLVLAALTPVPYVLFVWLSGSYGMKLRDFFLYATLPRTFRIGFVLWVLYIIGVI